MSLNGLPPGSFAIPIFDTVLNGQTIRGPIAQTRKDMQEAIAFALDGKVKSTVRGAKPEDINALMNEIKKGESNVRVAFETASP